MIDKALVSVSSTRQRKYAYQLLLNCSIVNENFIRIVYLSFLLIGKL